MNQEDFIYDLPDDLAEAFETMKLAITHHNASGWVNIGRSNVKAMLRWLEDLAEGRIPERNP